MVVFDGISVFPWASLFFFVFCPFCFIIFKYFGSTYRGFFVCSNNNKKIDICEGGKGGIVTRSNTHTSHMHTKIPEVTFLIKIYLLIGKKATNLNKSTRSLLIFSLSHNHILQSMGGGGKTYIN